jgi:predicted dehydrogenase
MILDPGHFHAALVQKKMYAEVDTCVDVYAPDGPEVQEHLNRVETFNNRIENPTHWKSVLHISPDYLDRMLHEKPGSLVVLAGNNRRKAEYIRAAVDAGIHVLSDKPMCIEASGWELLKSAFASAEHMGVLLYDIMTERFEITSILQRELIHFPEVFGELVPGSVDCPGVNKESVHHLSKLVAGRPLRRPPWYFDVSQQGEGLIDVATHLVDLVMWICFPEQQIDYSSAVHLLSARHWPTRVSRAEFERITGLRNFPSYLGPHISSDGALSYYCNGEMSYTLNGIHVRISVIWNFEAPAGAGDTHESRIRGSRADVIIHQGPAQNFLPELYVVPALSQIGRASWEKALKQSLARIGEKFPGVALQQEGRDWHVVIPEIYRVGHEAHFSQVTERYLQFLSQGELPIWEVPNMIAKYYTTTQALAIARDGA